MALLRTRIKRQPKLLSKLQWTLGLLLLPVLGLLFFATALVTQTIEYIPFEGEIAKAITEQHKERIKQMVTVMRAIIDAAVPQEYAIIGSDLTPEMQDQIKRMVRAARYDYESLYFILFHVDGTVIAQGTWPENVGMNRLREKDADGVPYIQRLGEAANRGGDFVQYKWKKQVGEEVYLKIAYTQTLRGGQWWLGSGFYVNTIMAEVRAQSETIWRKVCYIMIGLGIVLALSLLWVVYQANKVLVQTVAEPVARLIEGARRISAGEYGHRVEIDNNDELKVIADAFHCMGDNIGRTISDLQTAQEESKSLLEQNRALTDRERTLVEEERKRIARELHDDIGQKLVTLELLLYLAQTKENDDARQGVLVRAEKSIQAMTNGVRRILQNLRPVLLDGVGFSAALRVHLEEQAEDANLRIDIHEQASALRLPPEVESNIFRVVQEAMANVVRHAHAHRVDVWIQCTEEMLEVCVQDDGIGLDPKAMLWGPGVPQHFGITNMKERVRSLEGTIQFISVSTGGTKVVLRVPLMESAIERTSATEEGICP